MAEFRQQRQLSAFNRFMLWLNYAAILSLVVAILSKYIPPQLFWLPAFFGLAFPFIFLANLLFVFYWLFQFKSNFIFGLAVVCCSLPTAFRYVQFSASAKESESKLLSITSYNSMLFDLYNWKKNHVTRPKIFATLTDIHPDILCLQEFYTSEEENDFHNIDSVQKLFSFNYFHTEYTYTQFDFDHWGIATFSKYPIVNRGKILFNTASNNICIFTDVVIGQDTMRVYNLHLQSISFSDNDTKFLEQMVDEEKDAGEKIENSKSILRRLKRAFIKRAEQADMVAAHMKDCRHRIILCGDFNDTAASYAYEILSENLEDAFIEEGFGFGKTYAGKWPQFRIDYILHDPSIKCLRYQRSDETFTDHYPITAWLEL